MKLLRCHIENFGKLQNFDYEFKDGLNTIKEENGFGKTTFANFIKAMFYGLDASKSEKSERKNYMPWQGGKFGGNIEFEIQNKKYRIERFFEKKASDDTFKLFDLSTNLESLDYTDKIGEEIFKLNKESYERSTYIPQGKIQIEMDDSINAKLGKVLENENDVNTSDEAIKKIEETMKTYKKIGGKGLINEKKNKLNELKRNSENAKSDEENLDIRRKKLKSIIDEISKKEEEKSKKQKIINQKIEQGRKEAKLETYDAILKKYNLLDEQNKKLQEFFKGETPTDEELGILSTKSLEIEKYKGEMSIYEMPLQEKEIFEKLKQKFQNSDLNLNLINKKISEFNEIRDIDSKIQNLKIDREKANQKIIDLKREKKISSLLFIICLILGIILPIIGAILIFKQNNIGIIIFALGMVSLIITFLKKNNNIKNEIFMQEDNIESLNEVEVNLNKKKSNIENDATDFIKMYLNNFDDKMIALSEIKTEFSKYQDIIIIEENRTIKNAEIKEKLYLLEESIKEYLGKYFEVLDIPFSDLVHELKLKKAEQNRILYELGQTERQKNEYEKNNNIEELSNNNIGLNENEKDLNNQIKVLEEEIDKLNDEKNQNKNQIEVLENKIDENADLEIEIANLEEEIKEYTQKYEILEKTKKYMIEAKEKFSSHYLKGMINEFDKNLKLLDDKDLKTDVDINLGVTIDSNGAKRDIKSFSEGYKDLVYICMRFSLIKTLFEKELPFVILDDPFVNLDDEKTIKALDLIKKFSEDYQVIYFICNTSRIK